MIFYVYDGILAYPWPFRIQEDLVVLIGLFNRIGFRMNVNKTFVMTCQSCCLYGQHYDIEYTRKMTGKGPSYRLMQRLRVRCPDFRTELTDRDMVVHLQTQYGRGRGPQWEDTTPPLE